ncbi:hypothetical protein PFICI_08807 [Pestalotiopsis fici W106-1]|uniref:Post-SET domain-containing protein n=1 Tax=Pestalotiopsis fici (strain W106-1 / CGMCC3.15140) TaxID=1229662 RepID=W3WYU3_PESFW|nr:uncharacterized protein PFICI_08807 [Pestalotiopsis fici W106-1]ETS78954.1 hypothetical protein PFICI_08807 [Pestalotiopsis fici W106-1]
MSSPLKPHWHQPSHPAIQEVIINDHEFTSKSLSKVTLPPFGLFAKMDFPPCTWAEEPTYATVQVDKNKHLNLNSDLLYLNHSCEPSLIFDTANFNILVGPKGLQVGEELTFFYPSTEWEMAQPFDCFCGKATCRGRIAGAKDITPQQLAGLWINGHIRELIEQQGAGHSGKLSANGNTAAAASASSGQEAIEDPTALALKDALKQAEKVVEAAKYALRAYSESSQTKENGRFPTAGQSAVAEANAGYTHRGPTSRELSGEMGGDTAIAA